MMMNPANTVIYNGVTSGLWRRIIEHKEKRADSFTKKYNVTKLVWFEECASIVDAIAAEKKIKAGSRAKKVSLIKTINPGFKDLMMR